MSNTALQTYDVIIVGGGMVGACMAGALCNSVNTSHPTQQHSIRIAVIDTHAPPRDWSREQFDPRVSAISRATKNIFTAIGAWQNMVAERVTPYRAMHVWDSTGNGMIHFDSADIGEPELGHIIENRVILQGLLQVIEQNSHIDYLCPEQPVALDQHASHSSITLASGKSLAAKLIIGADGARSWVRQAAGIGTRQTSYRQKAVVTTVKTQLPHQDTAWQRFLPTGPLAFLPLTDNYSSIVWSADETRADELLALDDDAFKQQLQEALANKLGSIEYCDSRAAFPLHSQHANHYVTQRIALIGDAAHTIHPLAGQGVNLGFADAASLAEVLITAMQQGKDLGNTAVLRRYERWRKGNNLAMQSAMTGFKSLFGNNLPVLREIRNIGLNLTNQFTPMKNSLIRYAMGLEGDLPEIAKAVK